jgi:MFS family permease
MAKPALGEKMNAIRNFFAGLTLRPQGAIMVIAGFLPIIAIVSMFPVVPSLIGHFASDPDAKVKVPLMVAAPGLTMAVLAPFAGFFVDKFGRRKLLLWSTFLYGFFGAAPLLLDSLNAIFASRLLLGVCEAGILTIVNTLIGDYWDDKGRKNWLFLQAIVGPFLAAFVTLAAGYSVQLLWNGVFLIYLVAFPIWLGMVKYLYEPERPDKAQAKAVKTAPATAFPYSQAAMVAGLTLFASALYYVFIISGGLAFEELGVTQPERVGQLTFVPSLLVMLGAAIFKSISNKPNYVQLAAFLGMLGTGLAGIGLARSVEEMVLALCVQQTAVGMAVPTLISWTQTKFSFEHRGRGMGLWTGAFFFGQFSSPWLVHRLDLATGSVKGAFTVAGCAGLAMMIALLIGSRQSKAAVTAAS